MTGFIKNTILIAVLSCQLLLLCLPTLQAQVPGCSVQHFDNTNGLPQNSVTGLAFDKENFLWIGTHGGLVRYDGRSLENIADGELSSRIRMVFNTINGEALVADDKSNIVISKDGKYMTYLSKNYRHGQVNSIIGGNLLGEQYKFIDSGNRANYQLDYSGYSSRSLNSKIHFVCSKFFPEGAIIADTVLYLEEVNPLQHGFIGNVFLGVMHGREVITYNGNRYTGSIVRIAATNSHIDGSDFISHALWVQGVGKLYALYGGTFFAMSLKSNAIVLTPLFSNLPPFKLVNYLKFNEASATLAIGTITDGLFIVTPTIARAREVTNEGPARFNAEKYDNLRALLWTAKGQLLADNGFLYGKQVSTWINPDSIFPYNLAQDDDGKIWVKTTDNRIVVLNDDFSVHSKLSGDWGNGGFVKTDSQTYWLHYFDKISKVTYHGTKNNYTLEYTLPLKIAGHVRQMYRLNQQHFLLCTTQGLYKFNWATHQLTHIKNSNRYDFRGMGKSPGGNIYINTYGHGYYLFRSDSLVALPADRNKFLNYPHTFVFDGNGYVWITTNNGLFQINEQDLLDYANGNAREIYQHYYNYKDGFATNEFNGGGFQNGLMTPDGNLYFSSMNGLVVIDSRKIGPVLPKSPLFIKDVSVDERKIDQTDQLILPKGFSNLRVKLQTPYYRHPNNLIISYRIKGVSDGWIPLPENFEISVTTLNGGNYQIEFRKMNGFGKMNYSYLQLPFTVQKYFYETPLFYAMLLLLFLIAGYLYTGYRTTKLLRTKLVLEAEVERQTLLLQNRNILLKENNEALQTKTDMLNTVYGVVTHDLITPLRFVQRAVSKLGQLPRTELKTQIEMILNTTAHAERFVHGLLIWIKLNHDSAITNTDEITPDELIRKNMSLFFGLANERNVELRMVPSCNETFMLVSEELVSILIRNFIDNAIKYTAKGSISLKAYVESGMLNIFISDTGKGMAPEIVEQINARNVPYLLTVRGHLGMKIIFDILNILKGELKVQSELNKGTIFHLRIPVTT